MYYKDIPFIQASYGEDMVHGAAEVLLTHSGIT